MLLGLPLGNGGLLFPASEAVITFVGATIAALSLHPDMVMAKRLIPKMNRSMVCDIELVPS
jgi:hypothetical protein